LPVADPPPPGYPILLWLIDGNTMGKPPFAVQF